MCTTLQPWGARHGSSQHTYTASISQAVQYDEHERLGEESKFALLQHLLAQPRAVVQASVSFCRSRSWTGEILVHHARAGTLFSAK